MLVIRYVGFAMVATIANLGAQRAVLALDERSFVAALAAGTAVGLLTKYALDKKWIFYHARRALHHEARVFTLYAATGVGTTLLFWGIETAFWLIGQSHAMRELGAVLGLAIGYTVKFNLDRHFVFGKPAGPAGRALHGKVNQNQTGKKDAPADSVMQNKRDGVVILAPIDAELDDPYEPKN